MDIPIATSSTDTGDVNLPAFQLPQIEEMVKQERKTSRWVWIAVLASPLIGFLATKLFLQSDEPPNPDRIRLSFWQSMAMIATLPVCVFIVILAHELGHVVGGKIAGLKFLLLVVGPLKVTRSTQGLIWQVNRSVAMMGGLACCVPRDPKHFLRALRWMIIGGPLASLLLIAVCYFLSGYVNGLPISPSWMLFTTKLLKITGVITFMIAVVTIYPGTSASLKTDGRQFIELMRSNPHARRQNLVRLLVGQSLAGIRPSEWDSDVITELDQAYADLDDKEETLPERVIWSSLRSAVAVDQNDTEAAHKLIQFNLTHATLYPIFARGTLYLEAALFEARIRHDADAAEALIAAAPEGMLVESYLLPAAQAEVSRLRGDVEQAKTLAQKAFDETASALDAGSVTVEREHLLAIINGNSQVPQIPTQPDSA